ncbi:MAG: hypothetical protein IJJ71_02485 [Treponema sp.]|uniref:hypothetical protein n=1 Tax=Treponema sp. TaxID=166 RepID=UPI0025F8D781|nr:hypothetical protein [Treponema sp.]MBR0495027.1 hypothetical protein [Treponema sp.]
MFNSCSSFSSESENDGSIKIQFDSKIIQNVLSGRSAITYDSEKDEVAYAGDVSFRLTAILSGDYAAEASHKLTEQELANLESVSLSIDKIPVDSHVKLDVSLAYVWVYNSEHHHESNIAPRNYPIYAGSTEVDMASGENHVSVTLKNATVPYFSRTTKSQYFKSSGTVKLYGTLVTPLVYQLVTGEICPALYYFVSEKAPDDVSAEFQKYLASPSSDDYKGEDYTFTPVDTEYGNTSASQATGFMYEDTNRYDYPSESIDVSNRTTDFYAGWAIAYKTPQGTEKYLFSDVTKFTHGSTFSIASVSYTNSTGEDYELAGSVSKDNFKIKENWNGNEVEGDIENYLSDSDITDANKFLGAKTFMFQRYNSETSSCWVNIKFALPDFSDCELSFHSDSRTDENGTTFVSKGVSLTQKGGSAASESFYDRFYPSTYSYTNGETALVPYSNVCNWTLNGKPVENQSGSATYLDATDIGTGALQLELTVTPTEEVAQYCVDGSEAKTYKFTYTLK